MYDVDYIRAASVADAVAAFAAADDGRYLAGGMSLIPTLRQRLARPSLLVDLARLEELRAIRLDGAALVIGAMATHDQVSRSADVRRAIPALAALAGAIGDPQVRNLGTLGGSLANNDPSADYPAAALALNATIMTDRRRIPAEAFFTGMFATALEPGELIVAVSFPVPHAAGYAKVRQPASRYALVGVFVARTTTGASAAVIGASSRVFRPFEIEQALAEQFSAQALASLEMPAQGLNSDMHASATYRAHLIGVVARRALDSAQ